MECRHAPLHFASYPAECKRAPFHVNHSTMNMTSLFIIIGTPRRKPAKRNGKTTPAENDQKTKNAPTRTKTTKHTPHAQKRPKNPGRPKTKTTEKRQQMKSDGPLPRRVTNPARDFYEPVRVSCHQPPSSASPIRPQPNLSCSLQITLGTYTVAQSAALKLQIK